LSSSLEFGFEMKARWYHVIGAEIDGNLYLYSRGHWDNRAALIYEAGNGTRINGDIVNDRNAFVPMSIKMEPGTLTFYYDGKPVHVSKLPDAGRPYSVRLLFASHFAELQLRNFHISGVTLP
jgi:hypothetical protein